MSRKRTPSSGLISYAPVFAALGDQARLRIVARLCDGGPLSIVRLTEGADISRQAITKHLSALEIVVAQAENAFGSYKPGGLPMLAAISMKSRNSGTTDLGVSAPS